MIYYHIWINMVTSFLAGIVFLEYLNLPGLPAGIIMPAAGILIKSRGLNFPFTLITSVIAGLLGSWCLYAIGYYCGNPIIDKIENKFPKMKKPIDKTFKYIEKIPKSPYFSIYLNVLSIGFFILGNLFSILSIMGFPQ